MRGTKSTGWLTSYLCFLRLLYTVFLVSCSYTISSLCVAILVYYHGQACGAKYCFQEEDIDEIDVDDVVVALVNMARRVSFVSQ